MKQLDVDVSPFACSYTVIIIEIDMLNKQDFPRILPFYIFPARFAGILVFFLVWTFVKLQTDKVLYESTKQRHKPPCL